MAEALKRQFELTALKVTVQPRGAGLGARLELNTHRGGRPQTLVGRWLDAGELGMPSCPEPGWLPVALLPRDFVLELASALEELDLDPAHPLWLHFVKPYGLLGMLGWEETLVRALHRPVLRLPDFLEPPRENRDVLEVALCCSEPVSEPGIHPLHLLPMICRAMLAGSLRQHTRIHVFADEQFFGGLSAEFAHDAHVSVHDPATSARYGVTARNADSGAARRGVRNPWLLWMRDAMKGRSLDAVHFVCHGFFADERSALALAESPMSNRDREDARYVTAAELATFLTQTGAWSAFFSNPPRNYSEAGLRVVADTLAQMRPGPVVHHSLHPNTPLDELVDLYRFLYAPGPRPVPLQHDWFAYCQPALVLTQAPLVGGAPKRANRALDANAALFTPTPAIAAPVRRVRGRANAMAFAAPAAKDEVPSWVSASQRYVEQVSADLTREGDPRGAGAEVERTLAALQAIVASVAREKGDAEAGP
jgi:hypothetical protein